MDSIDDFMYSLVLAELHAHTYRVIAVFRAVAGAGSCLVIGTASGCSGSSEPMPSRVVLVVDYRAGFGGPHVMPAAFVHGGDIDCRAWYVQEPDGGKYVLHLRVPKSEGEQAKRDLIRVLGDTDIKTAHRPVFTAVPMSTGPYPVTAVPC